ncbi:hypothetical protein RhiirA4_472131 [Rhizophagus irregularis]|uniref:Uncharacterized protein n=1 Tax=Rhizophagus irregularis TaxID=588596 RepID=A0A2I1H4F1_9GLOM|nr:hypothetical protein RhiirA4_472131 [Rhizophagus irregularis]
MSIINFQYFADMLFTVCSKRFNDEINSAIKQNAKKKKLDKDNEYSTLTCMRIITDNADKAQDEKANNKKCMNADKKKIAF